MKIIADAFGGDHAPVEILKGCELAVGNLGVEILLTGREEEIRRAAAENGISLAGMEILDAPDVISMEDRPGEIMRSKKNCSMAAGLHALAEGKGDAFVSAGNSGALAVGATLIVKRIRGVNRIAFAPVIPNAKSCFMLIDCGANVDCKPEMLQQFGVMGSAYMKKVMGFSNPRVALANIGIEEEKGNALQRDAYALLKQADINFVGNLEVRDVPNDGAEVVVADGFTGNVILKMYEGVATLLLGKLKQIFKGSTHGKLAALIVMKDLKKFKKDFDYNEYGGAPLVGCTKPVFKAHGSSSAKTFYNALRLTKAYVEGGVTQNIVEALGRLQAEGGFPEKEKNDFGSEDS